MGEEDTGATNKTWLGKEFVAGSIAGASGVVFGHPLDTIKTRLQVVGSGSGSSSSKPNQYTSTTSAMFKHMSRKEGFGSFFRGLSWPLLSKSIEQCLIFGLNEECRKRLPLEGEALIVAAGAVAGGLGMGILTPVYVVKVQLQIPPRERVGNFRGPIQCAAFNFHKYGMKGLYAGLLPSLIANPICYGVRFITYTKCQEAIYHVKQNVWGAKGRKGEGEGGRAASAASDMTSQIIGGGIAGMMTWASAYPLDVVMSKMQAQGAQAKYEGKRRGMLWHIRDTYRTGGLKEFFKGLEPCLLRAFPVNAIIFLTFEQTMKLL